MSPKARNNEKSKLRMDNYSSDKNARQKGVSGPRREIDNVIKKARKDGTQSSYWTKKLLEVEEKEPDRWRHSGYKELYASSSEGENSSKGSPVAKKRPAMYSPSAPTSSNPARSSRRSSSNSRRNNRSVSSDMRRGSSQPRTDKFASSARTRTVTSPIRRPAVSPNRSNRSPVRRSRSPVRRNRSPVRRISPAAHRNTTPSRTRKSSPVRRLKSPPSHAARSATGRNKSPVSRQVKPDKAERRNRSVEKASASVRRKKAASRSPIKSPVRRISKARSRSPLPPKSVKRKNAQYRMRARDSSDSGSSSASPAPVRNKKNRSKKAPSNGALSSSDCSDSNCSMCRFEKSTKEKRSKKLTKVKVKHPVPPPEPRMKPRAQLPHLPPPMSSRYARSKSFSPVAASPASERRVEGKQHKKKSSKKEKKKAAIKASKAIATPIIHHKNIKVESPSDESESPSPKQITLSERFGKMAKWSQKKDVESNQQNIRVSSGDNHRIDEIDVPVPLIEPILEPPAMLLDGSWDDVRVRYAYYKDQGLLEDLTFQDYLKWEEWWYSYQEWLDQERMNSFRRRV